MIPIVDGSAVLGMLSGCVGRGSVSTWLSTISPGLHERARAFGCQVGLRELLVRRAYSRAAETVKSLQESLKLDKIRL